MVTDLVAEHASDTTSSAVRVGALNAVTRLLDAPQSHAVLRELLPSLGNLIHDKVEKVRLATVRMLIRIKKVPDIKYYHIVSLDHLCARFAEEGRINATNFVATALTNLMVNSYLPVGPKVTPMDQIRRTLKFLTDDPDAALVFYTNLYKFRPVDVVAKLCVKLLRCLQSAIENDQKRNRNKHHGKLGKRQRFVEISNAHHRDQCDDEEVDITEFPAVLMANLAETIGILWDSIESDLQGDEEWYNFVVGEFSGAALIKILTYCEDKAQRVNKDDYNDEKEAEWVRQDCHRASVAILHCAGRLPAKTVEGLVPYISSQLSLFDGFSNKENNRFASKASSHVALLCSWNMIDEVARSLVASIQSEYHDDWLVRSPEADTKKRHSCRIVANNDVDVVPHLPAKLALHILSDILRGSDPSSLAARESLLRSESASKSIEKVLELGTRYAERVLASDLVRDFNKFKCDGVSL